MTQKEIDEFIEIINLSDKEEKGFGDNTYYHYLGLIPFSDYNKSNYDERKKYINEQLGNNLELKNKARELINVANPELSNPQKKKLYDSKLKPILQKRIVMLIEFSVKKDKVLDKDEEENLYEYGQSLGFSKVDVKELIEEQRKIYNFTDGTSSRQNSSSTASTKAGSPILEIHNNAVYAKDKEFLFDNVKLSETRREIITIKNGGGGTLDAEAKYSAKWLEVSPKNIHQSNLPQDVSIIIDPSKDSGLKTGSDVKDTINLVYASDSGSTNVSIDVELIIEGHYSLLKRQTKYAVLVSSALALVTLLYFFSNVNFSGWAIFGFVVSAITIGFGAFAAAENEKNMGSLIIGGIVLLITNVKIFALLFTVIITFYAAKYLFKRNPFKNEYIGFIPLGSYILFWLFLVSTGGFNNYHNHTNYPTITNNNYPINTDNSPKTESINKTGYVSAEEYVNIRSGTSTDYGVVVTKNRGETVYVLERDKSTGWYKVDYGNGTGYISDKLISFDFIEKNNSKTSNKTTTDNINSNTTATDKEKKVYSRESEELKKADNKIEEDYERAYNQTQEDYKKSYDKFQEDYKKGYEATKNTTINNNTVDKNVEKHKDYIRNYNLLEKKIGVKLNNQSNNIVLTKDTFLTSSLYLEDENGLKYDAIFQIKNQYGNSTKLLTGNSFSIHSEKGNIIEHTNGNREIKDIKPGDMLTITIIEVKRISDNHIFPNLKYKIPPIVVKIK